MRWPAALAVAVVGVAIIGAVWQPHDPGGVDLLNTFAPPTLTHPLGTDHLGRDLAARVLAGAGPSLIAIAIGLVATLGIGVMAGLLIVFAGGGVRFVVERAAEAALAIPTLIVALVLGALIGAGPMTAGLALAATAWAPYAIATAGLTERLTAQPYWRATLALGAPLHRAAAQHIVPGLGPPIRALAGADAGRAVILVATLGFLGLSADTGRPDWGAMIHEYRLHAFNTPLLLAAPIVAIAALSLALHLLLDGGAGVGRRAVVLGRRSRWKGGTAKPLPSETHSLAKRP